MRKLICFLLCIIVCLGLSFGCAITSQNTLSTSEVESETQGESESEIESAPNQEETPKEEQKGSIYSLHALYEAGKLTQEDLLNIAYYSGNAQYNEELIGEDFVPTVDATLTPELENELLETIANVYRTRKINPWFVAQPESFEIVFYSGCYNGYNIVQYKEVYDNYYPVYFSYFLEIGGVVFEFAGSDETNSQIYGIINLGDSGVLEIKTPNLVKNLAYYYNKFDSFDMFEDFLQTNHPNNKIFNLNINSLNEVGKQDVKYAVRYFYESDTYPNLEKSKKFDNITLSFTIKDSKLLQYTNTEYLSVMVCVYDSSFSPYKMPEKLIYEGYRFRGVLYPELCLVYPEYNWLYPEYNYSVVLYNEKFEEFSVILYRAEQDIPLEYFENLFTLDKFETLEF